MHGISAPRLVGHVPVAIDGDDQSIRYLRSELEGMQVAEGVPQVSVSRVDDPGGLGSFDADMGHISVASDAMKITFPHGLMGSLTFTEDGAVVVRYFHRAKNGQKLSAAWQRGWDWNYLTENETVAKNVVYALLDQAIQYAGTTHGQTFLHASSLEWDGRGIAIAGWGGVGKTSSVMDLVMHSDYRFLSDDLAVVDSRGKVMLSPKRMQVYPYNTFGLDSVRDSVLRGRGVVDRSHWHVRHKVRGPKNTRRRLPASAIFGQHNIASEAQLDTFIHVERGAFRQATSREIGGPEAAKRSAAVLMYELKPLVELCLAWESAGGDGRLCLQNWRTRAEAVLAEALTGVQARHLQVPRDTTPAQMSQYIDGLVRG